MLPLLLSVSVQANSDIATLKQAYAQAKKCDWETWEGQEQAWRAIGNGLAKIMIRWPHEHLSNFSVASRTERLVKRAGLIGHWQHYDQPFIEIPMCASVYDGKTKKGVVCLIGLATAKENTEIGALLYFHREKSGMVCSILKIEGSSAYLPGPTSAILTPQGLLMTGMVNWYGNGPTSSCSLFQRRPDRWAHTLYQETGFECWGGEELRRAKGVKSCYEGYAEGRTYPRNLSTSHAEANVKMHARYFYDGKQLYMREWRGKSVLAKFDDLVGAVIGGREAVVQGICLRKRDATELMKFRSKLALCLNAFNSDTTNRTRSNNFNVPDIGKRFHFVMKEGEWRLAKLSSYTPKR